MGIDYGEKGTCRAVIWRGRRRRMGKRSQSETTDKGIERGPKVFEVLDLEWKGGPPPQPPNFGHFGPFSLSGMFQVQHSHFRDTRSLEYFGSILQIWPSTH